MKFIIWCLIFTLRLERDYIRAAQLEAYGADKSKVSVSGFSSGAMMSTQYHVAFSSELVGVGIIAGVSYYCAGNDGNVGSIKCATFAIQPREDELSSVIHNYEKSGLIDPTSNLAADNVFIFNGQGDTIINPRNGLNIASFYKRYNSNVLTEFNINAQHAMITNDYGNQCLLYWSPYINNCRYDAAYHTLNHIYGNLTKPNGTTQVDENLCEFDQSEFLQGIPGSSMDSVAYVYVPTYCKTNTGCRLHIALHGCLMGRQSIGEQYVRHGGYNDIAELNNIIILYPQVVKSSFNPDNPRGCYDGSGFTGCNYANKDGVQMMIIHNMMERMLA